MQRLRIALARTLLVCTLLIITSCSAGDVSSSQINAGRDQTSSFGVLVMAHGGGPEWNAGVEASLEEVRDRYPLAIAFGMADASSIEQAVRKLEVQGVEHVAVVRLFVSGESWYERTLQILGVLDGAPEKNESNHQILNPRMPMGYWRIETDLAFHVSTEGLAEAEEMDEVLLSRVSSMSADPPEEVVAVIAHGPADDGENERWIAEISERTLLLQERLGVRDIEVFTLREDWEEKRAGAEESIRRYIQRANERGIHPIVVPYRLQGFGPYATVLEGLEYRANGIGLVPHTNVALWIEGQVGELLLEVERERLRLVQNNEN